MSEIDKTSTGQESAAHAVNRFITTHQSFLGPDPEIMRSHHLAPRSRREEEILSRPVDANLHAEIRSILSAAVDEAFDVAEFTVASPGAQCGDMSTAVFTAAGDSTVTSTFGVIGFAVSLHYPIRYIRKYLENDPSVGLRPGDAFVINDNHFGGLHSPDQHLFMPVFWKEELIAWTCCAMHEGENGAKMPGGMGPDAETKWDEGFLGSPIRIVENYQFRTDLVTLLQNNSRDPFGMLMDLKARFACCRRLERRVLELVERYEVDQVIGFLRANVEYMRDEAASRLREMPDGTVRVTMYSDTLRENALIKYNFAFIKKGDRMTVDCRGSSPQIANRPINSLIQSQTLGIVMTVILHIWPDLPQGQALLDNFDLITDPLTVVDCDNEVPTCLCMQALFKIMTATEIGLPKFTYGLPTEYRYGKVHGGWYNQPASIIYGGINQHLNMVGNICADLNGMAGGAKCDEDGEHSIAPSFAAFVDVGESEQTEENLPFVYAISKRLWPDNIGFGKYRSGCGYQYGLMRYGDQPFGFQTFTGGSFYPTTLGLFGGYACPVYLVARIRGKNLFEEWKTRPHLFQTSIEYLMNEQPFADAKYSTHSMSVPFEFYSEGELFMVSQGAGGGYGDVLEREPSLVLKDFEENLISLRTAREIYHVVLDPITKSVDPSATAEARSAERQARKRRGMTWDDFHSRKVKPEPPANTNFFGNWNGSQELYAGPYGKGLPGQLPPIYIADPKDLELQDLRARVAALEAAREG